jgi:hypothetical protein
MTKRREKQKMIISDSAGVCVYGKIKEKRSGEKRKCHQKKQEG